MQNDYLIDGHRVIYDTGIGWHCVCAEFVKLGDCKHTRESAGRLAAQEQIKTRSRPNHDAFVSFNHNVESKPT
jgi:hypothetical protein